MRRLAMVRERWILWEQYKQRIYGFFCTRCFLVFNLQKWRVTPSTSHTGACCFAIYFFPSSFLSILLVLLLICFSTLGIIIMANGAIHITKSLRRPCFHLHKVSIWYCETEFDWKNVNWTSLLNYLRRRIFSFSAILLRI